MYDLIEISKCDGKTRIKNNIKTLKELKETANFKENEVYIRKVLKNLKTTFRKMKNKSQDYYRCERIKNTEWIEKIYNGEEIPF